MRRKRFDRLVREAVMGLPAEFRRQLDNVVVEVRDKPGRHQVSRREEESLLGLYIGVPLTERRIDDAARMPDQILLFQRPIEEMCATDVEIVEQIRITVVHEVGHYFGLEDAEIEAILGP